MPDSIRLWLLSSQRMVDDHWALAPLDFDWTQLLYYKDFTNRFDHGIYPNEASHIEGAPLVKQPFTFDSTNAGKSVHHLDFTSFIEGGKIHFKLYDKVNEIPQLKNLRKFPHIDTMLSNQVIINSIMNQIRRADHRTSKLKYLLDAMRDDITSRLRNGYTKEVVASCVFRYNAYQSNKGQKTFVKNSVRDMLLDVFRNFP